MSKSNQRVVRKFAQDHLRRSEGGVTYVFEQMAIGGSTGQSDWSAPGKGMAR